MDELIEYLEKKIQACDDIGGMKLEKFAFIVTLKKARKIAINYTHCCTELPTKETINTVASNKALKYAYANEDTYEDYVKAIEEGAEYVKNYLIKHE